MCYDCWCNLLYSQKNFTQERSLDKVETWWNIDEI